jgi:hypothetical protein
MVQSDSYPQDNPYLQLKKSLFIALAVVVTWSTSFFRAAILAPYMGGKKGALWFVLLLSSFWGAFERARSSALTATPLSCSDFTYCSGPITCNNYDIRVAADVVVTPSSFQS